MQSKKSHVLKAHYPIIYTPSQFTHKDYKLLHKTAKSGQLRLILYDARFRDKRILREINTPAREVLLCPFDQLGLYVNDDSSWVQDILKWRLTLVK